MITLRQDLPATGFRCPREQCYRLLPEIWRRHPLPPDEPLNKCRQYSETLQKVPRRFVPHQKPSLEAEKIEKRCLEASIKKLRYSLPAVRRVVSCCSFLDLSVSANQLSETRTLLPFFEAKPCTIGYRSSTLDRVSGTLTHILTQRDP